MRNCPEACGEVSGGHRKSRPAWGKPETVEVWALDCGWYTLEPLLLPGAQNSCGRGDHFLPPAPTPGSDSATDQQPAQHTGERKWEASPERLRPPKPSSQQAPGAQAHPWPGRPTSLRGSMSTGQTPSIPPCLGPTQEEKLREGIKTESRELE